MAGSTDNHVQRPVIIAGAGLVGLCLAQALKQHNIPYKIYERDESLDSHGGGGWAITLHWVMEYLEQILPKEIVDNIRKNHVQPEVLKQKKVPVIFQNLETGEAKYEREAPVHLRVHRSRLRDVLAEGIDVQWNKKFVRFEVKEEEGGGVKVRFADGTEVEGCMLAAADGKNSQVRKIIMGESEAEVHDLPIGFIGLQLKGSAEQMKAYRTPAPIFWQGSHPKSQYFIFCSMLSTPAVNGSEGTDEEYYEVQLNMSWPLSSSDDQPPSSNADKLRKMKEAANADSGFYPELREAIQQIPDDVTVLDIKLQDWPSKQWDNQQGRVTLLGDAAHPMTMYRGQAANHGLYDAVCLARALKSCFDSSNSSSTGSSASSSSTSASSSTVKTLDDAVCKYEEEMIARGREAVLASRDACIEAHYINDLKPDGPLMSLVQKPKTVGS